jgi:hypothetical protein
MSNFAVIENGKVINVIVAESKQIAEDVTNLNCVEIEWIPGAPGIGWGYNGETFTSPSA